MSFFSEENGTLEAAQAFLITGYIISFITLFYNQNIITYVAYSFQFIGLCGFLYSSYDKNIYSMFFPILAILFILAFNGYLIYKYGDKIENKEVPESYHSFDYASKWLIILENILVYYGISISKTTGNNNNNNNNSSSSAILFFLITINIIILITQNMILKSFSTDG